MTSRSPAPVIIHAYRRREHLRRTLDALRENRLSDRTEVFITSDGPRPGDEAQVAEVREFLGTVTGFKRVEIIARKTNNRLENWRFRRRMLGEHDRIVVVEDDCVTAPGFLAFMNECLDRYADDPGVFSVSGYIPPLPGVPADPFRLLRLGRFNAWGHGIFRRTERLIRPHPDPGEFNRLLDDPAFRRKVAREVGLPWFGMLRRVCLGKLLAFDVMANLEVLKRGLDVIYPSRSLVSNIGFDGSGEHCGDGDRFKVRTDTVVEPRWDRLEEADPARARRELARFHTHGLRRRWAIHSKRLRGRLHLPEDLAPPDREV